MTIDIVQLIEKNPITDLTKPYQSKLVNKIKHQFSSDEQHLFVASFYCYLTYKPTEFIIDLDTIWEWLGFARKDHAKRLLIKSFEENVDYKILILLKGENCIGRPNEQILMTQKTFKKLCMKADTKKADAPADYDRLSAKVQTYLKVLLEFQFCAYLLKLRKNLRTTQTGPLGIQGRDMKEDLSPLPDFYKYYTALQIL